MNVSDVQKLDYLKIFEDIDNFDRKYRNFESYVKTIQSGLDSPDKLVDFLQKNGSLKDCVFFLEQSLKYRRVNFYDEILDMASIKYPNNLHLLFYSSIFGSKLKNDNSDLDRMIDSNIFKYMEFALSQKIILAPINDDLVEIKLILQKIKDVKLPTLYKKPYLNLFSRFLKTGGYKRTANYTLLLEKLSNLVDTEMNVYDSAWYVRLYIRLFMSLIKDYEKNMYQKVYQQLMVENLDVPTARYNMLHLYNYANINNIDVDFSFIDEVNMKLLNEHPSTKMLNKNKDFLKNKKGNGKVAILIAGQIRNLTEGQIRIINTQQYEIDVYISAWEYKGFKVPYNLVPEPYYRIFPKDIVDILYQQGLLGDSLYQRYPSLLKLLKDGMKVDVDVLKTHQWISGCNTYKVKDVSIFSEEERVLDDVFSHFKLKKMENVAMNNQLKMFYMNYNSYLSMCKEESNNGYMYDYILKVRPDIMMDINLDSIIHEVGNKQVISADVMRALDCGDRVAFGKRAIMSQYMMMFENLHIYQNSSKTMFGCGTFKAHSPIDYQIVSSGGQVYRSAYIGVDNFVDLDIIERESMIGLMLQDAQMRGMDKVDEILFNQICV